jgi:hypothetical protein
MGNPNDLDLVLADLQTWTLTYGKALVPSGADTYGEGMRDAKKQVSAILARLYTPGEGGKREG